MPLYGVSHEQIAKRDFLSVIVFCHQDQFHGLVCERIEGIRAYPASDFISESNGAIKGLVSLDQYFYNVLDLMILLKEIGTPVKETQCSSEKLKAA